MIISVSARSYSETMTSTMTRNTAQHDAGDEPVTFQAHLTFVGGGSDKFYRLLVLGNVVISHYGRNGAKGAFCRKAYPTPERAQREAVRLYDSKTRKGYRLTPEGAQFADFTPEDCSLAAAAGITAKEMLRLKGSDEWDRDTVRFLASMNGGPTVGQFAAY